MPMRINKSWGDDLVGDVDELGVGGEGCIWDTCVERLDPVIDNQQRAVAHDLE